MAAVVACVSLVGCAGEGEGRRREVQEFLRMYEETSQPLVTVASEAKWKASTDVTERNVGERIGAEEALAAFRGSRYVIENSRRLLEQRASLSDLEFRQLDKILLSAAESPGTVPDLVRARIETEVSLSALRDGFTFCLEHRGGKCVKPITVNQIDQTLTTSGNLSERLRFWEASKQDGPALKLGLGQARDLRNRTATELGYSSYFHLQVADYGMSVAEMMQLMDRVLADTTPLYRQLHLCARQRLAERYGQPVPDQIPAHWLGDRWGRAWSGLAKNPGLEDALRGKSPEWTLRQAERFFTSLGWPSLPRSFWQKSDLYELPPGSGRKKDRHASSWHVDLDQDVRSLMSVVPGFRGFRNSHHELGHVYYDLAYSNPRVPIVLREGANRAFHEAVADLAALAARQQPYLRHIGLLPDGQVIDRNEWLLDEALDSAVVSLAFSAGTMTHFEYDLYEKKLPVDQFNRDWWELVGRHQGIRPPAARGEQFCDACTKAQIIADAARYYDYALAALIKYQLHDYIARQILRQDPHDCNYYGNKEVGKWLWEILSLGATRDWRQVLRERTGEEISSRALVEYFKPLADYLEKTNSEAW